MYYFMARGCALVAALAACTLLSSCGSTKLAAADAANVHTIRLSGFSEPTYNVQDRFVLKTSSAAPDKGVSFESLLASHGLHLGDEMKVAISLALRNDGYQIEDSGNADAILEVKFDGAPPNANPMYEGAPAVYQPEYSVHVTLTDAKTQKKIFHQFYVYRDNSVAPMDGTILIRPEPKYNFATAADLFNKPELAAEGFRAAIPIIAQSVGSQLKKPAVP